VVRSGSWPSRRPQPVTGRLRVEQSNNPIVVVETPHSDAGGDHGTHSGGGPPPSRFCHSGSLPRLPTPTPSQDSVTDFNVRGPRSARAALPTPAFFVESAHGVKATSTGYQARRRLDISAGNWQGTRNGG